MKLRRYILLLILTICVYANQASQNSVVKIFASVAVSNYLQPWQAPNIYNYTGSGAIIEKNRILTSAHVVSGAKFIEVSKENDPNKYKATLKYISNQADLAILEIEDEKFFENTKPLELNVNVNHKDEVTVLGYPIGGNAISTTKGIISRIEYTKYSWSQENLLTIQIDAAINSGNSGGPAVNQDNELVGIAMQKLKDSSNIAYIVPSIIIKTFLEDTKDGVVDGFHSNTTKFRNIENQSMKDHFGLKNGTGVLATFVDINDIELQKNDVILEIDSKKIANNGTIKTELGRVDFKLALHTKQVGSSIKLKIKRDDEIKEFDYKLKFSQKLINREFGEEPDYFIIGGLAFSPLTRNYLRILGFKGASVDMLFYNVEKNKEFKEPVVWLQTIFPHDINRGYISNSEIVDSVNGIKVKSFKDFISIVDNIEEEFIIIDMVEKVKLVLNAKEAKNSFKEIKKIYYLNSDRRIKK